MATLQITDNRPSGDSHADGKAYFETSTNKMLVWNATAGAWVEIDSDGTGAAYLNQYSLSFGGDDYLELGTSVKTYFDGVQGVSVRAVIKIPSLRSTNSVVFGQESADSGDNSLFTVRLNSSNKIDVIFRNSSGSYFIMDWANPVSADTWYDVVAVFDGSSSDILLYVNGDLKNTKDTVTDTTYTSSSNAKFRFGATGHQTFLRGFEGLIDEAAIFSYALSASQVASLMDTSGANPVPADLSSFINNGLAAWYRMGDDSNDSPVDGGSVASITDSSGNGYTATQGTVSSRPTFSTSVPS